MTAGPEVLLVVGARPNFMKAAPILAEIVRRGRLAASLLHTGQHYDERMSRLFFEELGLPEPDVDLGVGSGTHAEQTAEVMVRFEAHLTARERPPAAVIVVGDVNSTVACALVAAKAEIPLVHVEAGLRSFDRSMPEEINRIVTDALADVLYVTEESGVRNLEREGRAGEAVRLVGNTMIDTLVRHSERARAVGERERRRLGLAAGGYALLTLHRPSNVDRRETLAGILDALEKLARDTPIVWPIHPRTRARLEAFDLMESLGRTKGLLTLEPLGYLEFLGLAQGARLLLTDSGGIQEEAVVLKVPCVTLRENTERPVTLDVGGNALAGADPERIVEEARRMSRIDPSEIGTPPLWDGRAAERIVDDLEERLLDRVGQGGRG